MNTALLTMLVAGVALFVIPGWYASHVERASRRITVPEGPVWFGPSRIPFVFFSGCFLVAVILLVSTRRSEESWLLPGILVLILGGMLAIVLVPLAKSSVVIDDELVDFAGGIGPQAKLHRASIQSVSTGTFFSLEVRVAGLAAPVRIPLVFRNNALLLAMLRVSPHLPAHSPNTTPP